MWKNYILALVVMALLAVGTTDYEVLRLHVIANSDSAADQEVKLRVRDALLALEEDALLSAKNSETAEQQIRMDAENVLKTAADTLRESGFAYGVRLSIGNYGFPRREYAGAVFPAGSYRALRVVLGAGAGKNWWCVLYPPLCILEDGAGNIDTKDMKLDSYILKLLKKADYKLWVKITEFLRCS